MPATRYEITVYSGTCIGHMHKATYFAQHQIARERFTEQDAPAQATEKYAIALAAIGEYVFIRLELDLVGELINEENEALGFSGDMATLERYTIALVKLGREKGAQKAIDDYIVKYRRDPRLASFEKICARVTKAMCRAYPSAPSA